MISDEADGLCNNKPEPPPLPLTLPLPTSSLALLLTLQPDTASAGQFAKCLQCCWLAAAL